MDKQWINLDADKLFTEALGRPVTMMNDADAAGVAEMRFGAGKDKGGVVVMVTLGTGIGCAVFHRRRRWCPTPSSVTSRSTARTPSGWPRARARDDEKLTWKEYGKRIQKYLRKVDALLWPDLFIIGGGVSKEADKYLPDIKVRAPVVIGRAAQQRRHRRRRGARRVDGVTRRGRGPSCGLMPWPSRRREPFDLEHAVELLQADEGVPELGGVLPAGSRRHDGSRERRRALQVDDGYPDILARERNGGVRAGAHDGVPALVVGGVDHGEVDTGGLDGSVEPFEQAVTVVVDAGADLCVQRAHHVVAVGGPGRLESRAARGTAPPSVPRSAAGSRRPRCGF